MNRIQPKNGLSQMKKSAATGWRGLESYFGPENGNGESGGKEMRAGPSQSNLRSSKEQLPLQNFCFLEVRFLRQDSKIHFRFDSSRCWNP